LVHKKKGIKAKGAPMGGKNAELGLNRNGITRKKRMGAKQRGRSMSKRELEKEKRRGKEQPRPPIKKN